MPPDRRDMEEDELAQASEPDRAASGDSSEPSEASPRQELEVIQPELEVLAAPKGLVSVVSPIDDEDAPDAFVEMEDEIEADNLAAASELEPAESAPADLDEVEEIDDIEELDDFDVIEEDGDEAEEPMAAAPSAPAPAPARPAAPPPLPPRTPAPRPREAAPAAQRPRSATSVPPPVVAVSEAAPPLEPQLIAPAEVSVLDELLDGRVALNWKARAEKLMSELAQAGSPSRSGELAYELGDLYQRHLDDEASAVKAYGRALQADPSLRANLWSIRRIFYRRKLWPNLVKLIGAELRFASSDRQRADLQVERGLILLEHIADATGAQASFEQAVALDPENVTALLALERIARQSGDKPTLWQALRGLSAASAQPQRKAAFLIDLARDYRISREHLEDARKHLAEAAELDVLHEEVAREREALALAAEDASAFAASLERRIGRLAESFGPAGPPQAGEASEGSAKVLRKILALRRHQSQILAESGDHEGAWACLQEALAASPSDGLLLVDLADLAEQLGRYDELAELVAARESGEADPARALNLALRRAGALAKAGKQEEADELLRARSLATPGYLPLVVARELQAGARQSWRQLAALQVELADALRLGTSFGPGADSEAEPEAAANHYVVAGDLLRFGEDDIEAARTLYIQALEVAPGHTPAVQALASMHLASGAYEDLVGLLEQQRATATVAADSSEGLALLERLASLYFLLGRPSEELALIEQMRRARPEDAELRTRSVELLREQGQYEQLAAELRDLAREEDDPDAQARLFFEAGRLFQERLDKPKDAVACYQMCQSAWPEDVVLQSCLAEALASAKNWKALGEHLAAQLETCPDGPALSALGREALALAEFRRADTSAAIALGLSLCERQPDDLGLLLDAIACIEATDPAPEDSAPLADLLERLVALAEGELKSNALLRLGAVQLALGRVVDAEQSFRDAAAMGSLPAILKLHAMSASQGDARATADTLVAMAGALDSPAERSSLLEQAAWQRALALEEEEASSFFKSAIEADPSRPGSLVGSSLLAAKAGDKGLQGDCLERLSAIGTGSYASSSMLLRAGMLADVLGDDRLARERLEKSRLIAPQDAGTAVMTADRLAPLSPESTESVEVLLARAELCDMRSVLADAGPARIDWELERAEALEQAGQLGEALQAVASVLDQRPEHIRALQGLRRICLRGGDRQGQARAAAALAKQIGDSQGRLALLREAVGIFDGELGEVGASVATYRNILDEDPGAPEYERLIALLVEHDDIRALYRCYSARLNHLDVSGDQRARVAIFLARSRIRESIGDLRGASRDLRSLLEIDPNCSEALGERARLLERFGEAAEAAEHYQRFLAIEADPEQRARAELSLSQLMAESLDDVNGAIEQLQHVVRQSPRDVEIRERLVSLLLKAKRIEEAVVIIREQSALRASDGERARDELRIASLLKDGEDKGPALSSLSRARQYDPLNMDAVRDLIELVGGGGKRDELLQSATDDIRRAIGDDPVRGGLYERLVTIGQWGSDTSLQRQALEALAVAANLSADQQATLEALGQPLPKLGEPLTPELWRTDIVHHDASGFAAELWSLIGPAVAELADATPTALGFERGDRIKARALEKSHPVIAGMASFLELETIETYVSSTRIGVARAVSAETPTVCFGAKIAAGKTREQRFAIARSLAHAKAGTGTAAELEEPELFLYFAAAAELAGVNPLPAKLAERVDASAVSTATKRLSKVLGRRARKDLMLLASRFSELGNPMRWRRGTQLSAARLGLLLCGSLGAAFDVLDVGKGGRPLSEDRVAQGLLAWSVGRQHLALRARLGDTKGNDV